MKARQLLRIRYDGDGLASKIAAIDQEVDVGGPAWLMSR